MAVCIHGVQSHIRCRDCEHVSEVERLRGETRQLREDNARLRQALAEVLAGIDGYGPYDGIDDIERLCGLARDALAGR